MDDMQDQISTLWVSTRKLTILTECTRALRTDPAYAEWQHDVALDALFAALDEPNNFWLRIPDIGDTLAAKVNGWLEICVGRYFQRMRKGTGVKA